MNKQEDSYMNRIEERNRKFQEEPQDTKDCAPSPAVGNEVCLDMQAEKLWDEPKADTNAIDLKSKTLKEIWYEYLAPAIEEQLDTAQKEHGESWRDTEYDDFDADCGGLYQRTRYEVSRKLLSHIVNGNIGELAGACIYIAILFGRAEHGQEE